jgi:hypothetical protein
LAQIRVTIFEIHETERQIDRVAATLIVEPLDLA